MQPDEKASLGATLEHYWRVVNLVYRMSDRLQGAAERRGCLAIGAEFALEMTEAHGSCAFVLREPDRSLDEYVCRPDAAVLAWDRLLSADSAFRRQVLERGGFWQGRGFPMEAEGSTAAVAYLLVVPLKRQDDAVFGAIAVWRDATKSSFGSPERDLLQLCANQVALVIESLRRFQKNQRLQLLLDEKTAAWEALSREMAHQFRGATTLMDLWLGELGQIVRTLCAEDRARLEEQEQFLARVRAVFRDTEAMTREFLFDPSGPSNRVQLAAEEEIRRVVASIPRAADRVSIAGPGGLVFANSRRVRVALRDILHATLNCLPEGGKLEVEVGPKADDPSQISIVFVVRGPIRLSPDGSVFQFEQDELVKRLVEMERGAYREWQAETDHIIAITWPAPVTDEG